MNIIKQNIIKSTQFLLQWRRLNKGGSQPSSKFKIHFLTYPMPATTPACIAVDSEGRHGTNVGDDPNRESLDYRHGGIRFLVTKIIVKQVHSE